MEQITTHLLWEKGYMAVKEEARFFLESDGRFGRKRAGEICHHIYTQLCLGMTECRDEVDWMTEKKGADTSAVRATGRTNMFDTNKWFQGNCR